MEVETDKGNIQETYSPGIIIPLNGNYFEIGGNLKDEKNGTIEDTKTITLPMDKKKVTILGIAAVICLIGIVFVIFFTKSVVIDEHEKALKKIFKKHGDRFVALNTEAIVTFKNRNVVKSIDDLVKISDEIGKPIMYKYSSDFKDITKFYVFDEIQIYVLDLKDISIKEDIEVSEEIILKKEPQKEGQGKEDESGETE
jgi:uncharacterized protein DUF5305